jgi:hypothetical protein
MAPRQAVPKDNPRTPALSFSGTPLYAEADAERQALQEFRMTLGQHELECLREFNLLLGIGIGRLTNPHGGDEDRLFGRRGSRFHRPRKSVICRNLGAVYELDRKG